MSATNATRRRFLSFCTGVLTAGIGLLIAIPAVAYCFAPLRRKSAGKSAAPVFLDLGLVSDFPVGQWSLRVLEVVHEDAWKKKNPVQHAVWVHRQAEGDLAFLLLSPVCPHLVCPTNWNPEKAQFICPCHGGIFDTTGQHVSGPPPRGMDALEFEVRAGRLWVRWQDFQIGVAERVPVTV